MSVLFVGTYIASWWFGLTIDNKTSFITFAFGFGELTVVGDPTTPPIDWTAFDVFSIERLGSRGRLYKSTWLYSWYASKNFYLLVIALWPLVAALVAGNVFWYWRDWRRRVRPGHCAKCGYNLTGNISGRCPECGQVSSPATE